MKEYFNYNNLIKTTSDFIKAYIKNDTIIFYDACSISHHARKNPLTDKFDIIDYFTEKHLIIVTKTILNEITVHTNGTLSLQYQNFFRDLAYNGIEVYFLDETLLEEILQTKYNSIDYIKNIVLDTLKIVLKDIPNKQLKEMLFNKNISKNNFSKLIPSILQVFDKNKGELSVLICIAILKKLKSKNFIILTDDKKCVSPMKSILENRLANINFAIKSTPAIIQQLLCRASTWESGDLFHKINTLRPNLDTYVLYNKIIENIKYDNVITKQLSNTELLEKIINNEIDIIF